MAEVVIGVDIGGTAMKAGLVSRAGGVLARVEEQTPHDLGAEKIVNRITRRVDELFAAARERCCRPEAIGVAVCGYLTAGGDVPAYINLHALDDYPLARHLADRYGIPVLMDNDSNCAALGEYHFGGGVRAARQMVMTVGTGIGMAMMIGGDLLRFHAGTIGNPGHIVVAANGPVCVAGCRGCLESLASAGAISRLAEDVARSQRSTALAPLFVQKGSLTPEDVYEAAQADDVAAQGIWREVGAWLGRGLASWVEIFGPEVVVVGGGIACAGRWLVEPIEQEMRRVGEPYFTRNVREVRASRLATDLSMLGAASLVLFPERTRQSGAAQAHSSD